MNNNDPRLLPRVLYIEDNVDARSLVRRLLAGRYIVLEASDPLDGLQLAEETHPNLVLLDHNLPRMTGSEAATRLRKILPDAPLVIVSADVSKGAHERALAAGAAGFISKPIDVDTFVEQIESYLHGRREKLDDAEVHLRAFQQELSERLEDNVRQLTIALEKNEYLLRQNEQMISMLARRQKLLEAAARVGHAITSILELDGLLFSTVETICSEFGLYYSGIFLLSEDGQFAVLHAGAGEPGRKMLSENFRLPVNDHSMVGQAILQKRAQIALDVNQGENAHFKNPYLPQTRSEIALPLIVKSRVLGTLTVQSDQIDGFAEEDVTALQTMADQVAIAINNAQLLQKLELANSELVRTKTFEAIATATGEAIHWVGNKAAPIPGSVNRLKEDLEHLLALIFLLRRAESQNIDSIQAVADGLVEDAEMNGMNLGELASAMLNYPPRRLQALLDVESMLEDLRIIDHSAVVILNIKEDLIGPARQRHAVAFSLIEMLSTLVATMGLPKGVIQTDWPADLPMLFGDARQVEQVFNNLVKNAWEALDGTPQPRIYINAHLDDDPNFVLVTVRDNGPGIPPEIQEKIWVSFFTTKSSKGGTGLGLSACMQIVKQNGGKIWLHSVVGKGATFYVQMPVAAGKS